MEPSELPVEEQIVPEAPQKDPIPKKSKRLHLEQKKALGIVLTGNFLEYFDLMLFSHLSFLINPYFMPKTDPIVAKMLAIFAFSSSFVIRPFAAYFWGYVGDNFGRVVVLSYTTLIMAVTCVLIANIPPYVEWGIYSTAAIIFCRVLQGFSSAGEAKGAEIFVAEVVPTFPKIFLASALVPVTCDLGGLFATLLGSACLAIPMDDPSKGWKLCFYIGAAIAFCSSITRKKLKETREFLSQTKSKPMPPTEEEKKYERRNFFALMGLNMICPTAFFFAYSYCSDILMDKVGLSASAILLSNSSLLAGEIFFLLFCARLAYKYNPFTILKIRTYASFVLMPLCFTLVWLNTNHLTVYLAQMVVLLSTASFDPATPIVIRSFSLRSRFSKYSKAWAFAKAFMYLSTGYLTLSLDYWLGVWGVLGLLLFFSGIFAVSLHKFVPHRELMKPFLASGEESFETHSQDLNEQPKRDRLKRWVEK
jgi:MHS family proline/betaine transporter-like MFS transporter